MKINYAYIITILALFGYILLTSKHGEPKVKVVTVYKDTIIPEKEGNFITLHPTASPVNVVIKNDELLNVLISKLNSINDSIDKQNFLIKQLRVKEYKNEYNDSLIQITVIDSVNGLLKNQKLDYKIKEQKITTKTEIKYIPYTNKRNVSIGTNIPVGSIFYSPEIVLGYENKQGWEFELSKPIIKQDSIFQPFLHLRLKKTIFRF